MPKKKKNLEKIVQGSMSNGMNIVLVPAKNSELISIGMFVKAGVINENHKNNGISHFLEHMMFQGTTKRSGLKIAEDLDKVGASYNAATSYEFTFYDIIGQKKDLNLFLEIIIDIFYNSKLDLKNINREKKIVLEEMRMYKDDNKSILDDIMHKRMYRGSSLSMPILGTETNVKKFTKKDLEDYRKKFYVDKTSTLVIIGDVNLNDITKKLNNMFSKFGKTKNQDYHNYCPKLINQIRPFLSITYNSNVEQTLVKIVFRCFGRNAPYVEAIQTLEEVLTSGSSSRLFHLLRNKLAVTYFNFVELEQFETIGSFIITVGVQRNQEANVIKAILKEITKLKTKKIAKGELAKIEKIRETQQLMRAESMIQDSLYSYGIDSLFSNQENFQFDKMSPNDIMKVAQAIFSPENLNVFILGKFNQKNEVIDILDKFK